MKPVIPAKLRPGDRLQVIAPSRSLTTICSSEVEKQSHERSIARLESLGLCVTMGEHIWESGAFGCPSVEQRLADLHQAFRDPEVAGIITVIGGSNGNQLLDGIDYELIARNPKVFCGYSDITVLQGAFLKKAQLVTYSGPHISTFGMKHGIEYSLEGFQDAVMRSGPYRLQPSAHWADDSWFLDQENRNFIENPGWQVIQPGEAEGRIVGGNLSTFALLRGSPYMPEISGCLLFLEDPRDLATFDRQLQGLLHGPGGDSIAGLVIGRFPIASGASPELMEHVVATKAQLKGKPVIYGVDFGHTTPHITFPIGGTARIRAVHQHPEIEIGEH